MSKSPNMTHLTLKTPAFYLEIYPFGSDRFSSREGILLLKPSGEHLVRLQGEPRSRSLSFFFLFSISNTSVLLVALTSRGQQQSDVSSGSDLLPGSAD